MRIMTRINFVCAVLLAVSLMSGCSSEATLPETTTSIDISTATASNPESFDDWLTQPDREQSTETESSQASASPTQAAIDQSVPTHLYQPDTGLDIDVETLGSDRREPIDPAHKTIAAWNPTPLPKQPTQPELYYAPGESTPDISVIAGHTGTITRNAAFNPLYDWEREAFQMDIGNELFVSTEESDEMRLVYELRQQFHVEKGELRNSEKVWGSAPKPDTLLLIGCKQVGIGKKSFENLVFEFVLVDVRPSNR